MRSNHPAGTKVDLREDEQVLARVKEQQLSGAELAKVLGCYSYRECSAKQLKGLPEIFEDAIRAVMVAVKKQEKDRC